MDNLSNYQLNEVIGEGGFATVHRAIRINTNEVLAIKIINKSKMIEVNVLLKKIEDEINIQQNLSNPHIVHCSSAFSDCDHIYIVLEICNGGNLFNCLLDIKDERNGLAFNESESVFFLFQLLSGLHYLHKRKVVHRDLKLSNILLHYDDRNSAPTLKLCDFGFAFIQEHPDQENVTLCGTPNYISPEMTSGATSQSAALDMWAAGVIFYWLVTGSPPFNRNAKERNGPPPDFDTKFVEPSSDVLSAEGRDFLRSLLQKV
jgi:serine/threonine protein kinase